MKGSPHATDFNNTDHINRCLLLGWIEDKIQMIEAQQQVALQRSMAGYPSVDDIVICGIYLRTLNLWKEELSRL